MRKEIVKIPNWFEPKSIPDAKLKIISLGQNMSEHAYIIGKTLIWVKENLKHGEFQDWVDNNLWFAERTARKFMEFSEEADIKGIIPKRIYEIKELKSAESAVLETPELPEGKYQVIYMDLPWKYDVDLSTGATRSPENNYPVMDLEEIKEFGKKVKDLAANNCVLFMWITAPKLNWMNEVLEACGFEYKTNLIWDKIKPNLGHYSSVRHEILIIAGRGKCAPICDGKTIQSIDSVQSIEKSSRHSEKPDKFKDIIDMLYPDYKKIELFARKKEDRKNWSFWGNEIL
mgnify:CR=1 FL=1